MARACGSYPQCPEFESQHRHQIFIEKLKTFLGRKVFNCKRAKNVRREGSTNYKEV